MELNGIDLDNLTPDDLSAFPSTTEGRVLQLDGDVVLYHSTYQEDYTLPEAIDTFFSLCDYKRRMSGSQYVNIHLTAGNKGGRFDIATVKEYQIDRRKSKERNPPPPLLGELRSYILTVPDPPDCCIKVHEEQEADDGMTQGNYIAIQNGTPELSVIMSIDKDLWMCSGWHCDWESMELTYVENFGSIYLDRSGSTPKIRGKGTSFFWAQLLMGDGADSIPGLPKLGVPLLNEVDPTKKVTKDLEIINTHTEDSAKYKPAMKRLESRKPKSCGTITAWKILENCKSDHEALQLCIQAYNSYYNFEEYTTWDGKVIQSDCLAMSMLLEQARLLWMRREISEDVTVFFKDVVEGRLWMKIPTEISKES